MIYSDIHVHTKYCDALNSPEEVVKKAIEMGFESIGFSGHGYTDFDLSYCMTLENTKKYVDEVKFLKTKYPQIDILLGIERDYYYSNDGFEYDFVIGSLHYVKKDGKMLTVDIFEDFSKNVEKYFDGNYMEFVESYYNTLKDIVIKTDADIVGHFDLIAKFNEGNKYFDEDSDWYKRCALDALYEVAKQKSIFEVNTGAICRNYKTEPYPAKFILKEIKKLGCDIILTSDCHNIENLGFGYDKSIEYVKECGFNQVKVLTKRGFETRKL